MSFPKEEHERWQKLAPLFSQLIAQDTQPKNSPKADYRRRFPYIYIDELELGPCDCLEHNNRRPGWKPSSDFSRDYATNKPPTKLPPKLVADDRRSFGEEGEEKAVPEFSHNRENIFQLADIMQGKELRCSGPWYNDPVIEDDEHFVFSWPTNRRSQENKYAESEKFKISSDMQNPDFSCSLSPNNSIVESTYDSSDQKPSVCKPQEIAPCVSISEEDQIFEALISNPLLSIPTYLPEEEIHHTFPTTFTSHFPPENPLLKTRCSFPPRGSNFSAALPPLTQTCRKPPLLPTPRPSSDWIQVPPRPILPLRSGLLPHPGLNFLNLPPGFRSQPPRVPLQRPLMPFKGTSGCSF